MTQLNSSHSSVFSALSQDSHGVAAGASGEQPAAGSRLIKYDHTHYAAVLSESATASFGSNLAAFYPEQ